MPGGTRSGRGHVYFEFHQIGQQFRVAAIDEATGIEVVIVAPASTTQARMQEVALAKLNRALRQAASSSARDEPGI